MTKQYFILPIGRQSALDAVRNAPDGMSVTIAEVQRGRGSAAVFQKVGYGRG
jgi:hypothetical protein